MCLITLASLVEIIPSKDANILMLNGREVSSFVEILCEASTEHDLTARKIYGSLVVPVEDMLTIIKALCLIEANRLIVVEHISMILMSIELCINNGTDDHVLSALDLLWTLINKLSISCDDLAQNAGTLHINVDEISKKKDKPAVSSIALCIVHTLKPVDTKGQYNLISHLSSRCLLCSSSYYQEPIIDLGITELQNNTIIIIILCSFALFGYLHIDNRSPK